MSRFRLFLEWVTILAFSLGIAWWAMNSGVTTRLDNQILDFAATRSASPASDDILIAAIDDRSLAELGKWPWDRTHTARMVDMLSAAGARLIILDVLFVEPSSSVADAALGESIAASRRVALPHGFTPARDRTSGIDLLEPIAELRQGAAAIGHVGLEPDSDGLIRRMALAPADGSARYPHLTVAALEWLNGAIPAAVRRENAGDTPAVLPLRRTGSYRTVPAASVVRGEVPAGFIAGKTVIVGATALGLGDSYPVSAMAGGVMSGAELQANLLQALTEDSFITPVDDAQAFAIASAAILLMFLGFWRLRPTYSLVLATTLILGTLSISLFLVTAHQRWFAPAPAMLALVVAYPLWGWRRLAAVSGFLDSEAGKLQPVVSTIPGAATLGGFDSVAKQVSRLEFLVDEISERRAFLIRVLEATPDAMCVFDKDGALLLMNARARALFGAESDALSLNDLVIAVRGRFNEEHDDLLLEDGRTFAVASSIGADGAQWDGIHISVFTEITELRRAETERRQMLEFLSHDMRSPQVAILGLASPGGAQVPEGDRAERIRGHARRTMKLADDFVQLARLAEAPLQLLVTDICALVDEALDRAWPQAQARHIALQRTLPDDEVLVQGDADTLSRMLDNLIGNAIKYGPDGGTVEAKVALHETTSVQAIITIADSGPGLPPERQVDPFRRFGSRGGAQQPGAGLGLAFVKTAVERHHGTIRWSSTEGKGTIFTIGLPAANAQSAAIDDQD